MTRKFALAAVALVLATGLCLAAGITATSPYAKQAKTASLNNMTARTPVNHVNGKVWHLEEGFEGSWLPAGWSLAGAANLWSQFAVSGYGVGAYSARANFYGVSSGSQDLITATFPATVAGDSVKFDHAYATYSGEVDQLQISTSDNGGSNWTVLITLNGGASGPLNTGGTMTAIFVPTAGQWATKSYAVPAGTNAIKFTAITAYGNQLYLDNVAVGVEEILNHNLAMQSIDVPASSPIEPGTPFTPTVTVSNTGSNPEVDFWVYYSIDDGSKTEVYSASQQVSDTLQPSTTAQFTFSDFTPAVGSYSVTAWVELAGDEYPGDDTLDFAFGASFMGWQALTPTAPVAVQWPGGCTDGQYLYSVGGLVAGSTVTGAVQVYDPVANSWSQPTTLPVALFRTNCAVIDGKLYAIGGMDAGFTAQAQTQIYDIAGNTWTTGTPPPSARGGCGGGVIDGKMYIVGGAVSGTFPTDCPTWEYNPAADTSGGAPWTQLADCPRGTGGMILGAPFWGAPGLDFIVAGGDYRGYDDYYMFNPSGGWATLATGPTDAGSKDPGLLWDNEHIYLFGGDPNGGWAGYSDKTYHYDLVAGAWENLNIPLNQAYEGMIGAIIDQKIYSFSGTIGSGPVDPTPFEWTYDLTYGATTPPEITWFSPADGATQVRRREPVVLAFSKPMDPGTFDGYMDPTVNMDLAWNATNDTLTLTPAYNGLYDYGTAYSAIVTAGADTDGVSLEGLPLTVTNFTTWLAPEIIQSQMDAPGNTYVSQIFEPAYAAYTSYLSDDVNLAGMDSVKVTAIELVGGAWNGHTWHHMDSLYLSFTTDSTDLPAWSQEIWGGNLLPGTFEDIYDGVNNTYIMYLDPPVMLGNGKSWMTFAPYMNLNSKDGQCGWAVNDPAVVYGSGPAFRNPGGGFSAGTDWQRASVINMLGDGVWRTLGYTYPTGVAGGPTAATKAVFALMPNFPNPVTGRTTFSFSLPKASDYSLKVYNISGQLVESFAGKGQAGANSVNWNAQKTGAGVYFFQLNAGGQSATRKLVIIK